MLILIVCEKLCDGLVDCVWLITSELETVVIIVGDRLVVIVKLCNNEGSSVDICDIVPLEVNEDDCEGEEICDGDGA
jgi:hypothetical protein